MPEKKALVIGIGSTIGKHIALQLEADGYTVYGSYCNTLTPGPRNYPCDLRSQAQVDALFGRFGYLNVVVLAAFPFFEADPFDWHAFEEAQTFHTGNMRAIWQASRTLDPGGRIVNILGQCVRNGLPSAPHYSAYFAAMHNFSKSVNGHPQYGKRGRVSMIDVLLAAVDTREWNGVSPEVKATYEARMSQFIQPAEVARRVVFELSCEVMATELVVDGYVLV
jgi:NAD(P)-dependent dehydrogenase (short-subunit alcohol dehydrogenase family)